MKMVREKQSIYTLIHYRLTVTRMDFEIKKIMSGGKPGLHMSEGKAKIGSKMPHVYCSSFQETERKTETTSGKDKFEQKAEYKPIDEDDICIVVRETGCDREKAIEMLKRFGNLVDAILTLLP